ncbi:hypothetical protein [uncultured Nostoc sp.]|uniref:hypothetical protein n=1 Tax=uncultured Nostoc sp. TaxID=340711 RepID=UPI0035CB2962
MYAEITNVYAEVTNANSEIANAIAEITNAYAEVTNAFAEVTNAFAFIITKSPEILILTAPVIIVVKAKKENINAGFGQCAAEMVAAQIFNQQAPTEIKTIYGAVTTGSIWQFLKLEEQILSINLSEYYLKDVNKILGILASSISQEN